MIDRYDDPEATYFVWIFDPRFDPLLHEYLRYRKAIHSGPQIPIIVRSFDCLKKPIGPLVVLSRNTANKICQEEPEDLNVTFCNYFQNTHEFRLLLERQENIDVVSFTNEKLSPLPHLNIFGAAPAVADRLNSKTYQHGLFQREGVKQPHSIVLSSFREVEGHYPTIHSELGDFLLRPAYSAGGWKSCLITSRYDLCSYKSIIPSPDLDNSFLASAFLKVVSTPAAWGIVTFGGEVIALGVCDQILNGFRFIGDIYPSFLSPNRQHELLEITLAIGEAIASEGYRGFYGVDFVMNDDGDVFTTELNARFTFGVLALLNFISHNLFSVIASTLGSISNSLVTPLVPTDRILLFKLPTHNPEPQSEDLVHALADNTNSTSLLSAFADEYWSRQVTIRYGSYRGLATARFSLSADYATVLSHFKMEYKTI